MRKAIAVIGANYGDEGKGLMTDYFAAQDPEHSLVVRYNGGAQAGHTVVSPDGRRHVFSHFGSGSFLECPTYLSKYFIVNPLLFVKELAELQTKNIAPSVYIDINSQVTTPFDVFINQLIETRRGKTRHGSCGVGINETVSRCLRDTAFRTRVADLFDKNKLLQHLSTLSEKWLPARLSEHGIKLDEDDVRSFMNKQQQIFERYAQDVRTLLERSIVTDICPLYPNIIFEGAQGLLLDEARLDQYPHLTRSRTGLTNVVELSRTMRLDELEVYYLTRTYLTKHGAGPLPGEENWSFPDRTNIPNAFQGHLRFAHLDPEQLSYSIRLDLEQARHKFRKITAGLAVTCTDQMPLRRKADLPLAVSYISEGPSRENVRKPVFLCTARSA